jgi:transporter family-2 protein
MSSVFLATVVTLIAGGLIALQAPLLAELGDSVGAIAAACINFIGGSLILVAIAALVGGLGDVGEVRSVPWYYVVGGGALGALYVLTVVITVGSLGAGGITAATLAGQMTTSVVIDRFGALGLVEREISVERIAGIALLVIGTFLVVR